MSVTNPYTQRMSRIEALKSLPTIEGEGLSACIARENQHMCEEALYSCALAIMQLSHALESPLVGSSARLSLHAARHETLRCARALEAISAHTGAVPLSDAWHDRLVQELQGSWDREDPGEGSATRPSIVERLHLWWETRSRDRAVKKARSRELDDTDVFEDPWEFDWGGVR